MQIIIYENKDIMKGGNMTLFGFGFLKIPMDLDLDFFCFLSHSSMAYLQKKPFRKEPISDRPNNFFK